MNHKPHCPVHLISYTGNLIVAAAQKYPKVIARLPANYIPDATTALSRLPGDATGQKIAKGEAATLTAAQQASLVVLLHCMSQARKTAKLALPGQTVKLHEEFQIGIHESHELSAVLGRADIILAGVQTAVNLPLLKLKGWTDADTAAFVAVRATFPATSVAQQSGVSDGLKATGVKASDAASAYEHILTIQNAADLEFPPTNPANAATRAEFK